MKKLKTQFPKGRAALPACFPFLPFLRKSAWSAGILFLLALRGYCLTPLSFQITEFTGSAFPRPIILKPIQQVWQYNGVTYYGVMTTNQPPCTNSYPPGSYYLSIQGISRNWRIDVPDTNVVIDAFSQSVDMPIYVMNLSGLTNVSANVDTNALASNIVAQAESQLSGDFLPISGGPLTGPITLPGLLLDVASSIKSNTASIAALQTASVSAQTATTIVQNAVAPLLSSTNGSALNLGLALDGTTFPGNQTVLRYHLWPNIDYQPTFSIRQEEGAPGYETNDFVDVQWGTPNQAFMNAELILNGGLSINGSLVLNNSGVDVATQLVTAQTKIQVISSNYTSSSVLPLNAKSAGAYGDGVHDDTIALQNAINSLSGTANALYLPAGKYLTRNTIVLTAGMHLLGDGANQPYGLANGTAIVMIGTNQPIVTMSGGYVEVEKLSLFYSAQQPATATNANNVDMSGSFVSLIRDVNLAAGYNGIYASAANGCFNNTIDHIYVNSFSHSAISTPGGSTMMTVLAPYIQNFGSGASVVFTNIVVSGAGELVTFYLAATNTTPSAWTTNFMITPQGIDADYCRYWPIIGYTPTTITVTNLGSILSDPVLTNGSLIMPESICTGPVLDFEGSEISLIGADIEHFISTSTNIVCALGSIVNFNGIHIENAFCLTNTHVFDVNGGANIGDVILLDSGFAAGTTNYLIYDEVGNATYSQGTGSGVQAGDICFAMDNFFNAQMFVGGTAIAKSYSPSVNRLSYYYAPEMPLLGSAWERAALPAQIAPLTPFATGNGASLTNVPSSALQTSVSNSVYSWTLSTNNFGQLISSGGYMTTIWSNGAACVLWTNSSNWLKTQLNTAAPAWTNVVWIVSGYFLPNFTNAGAILSESAQVTGAVNVASQSFPSNSWSLFTASFWGLTNGSYLNFDWTTNGNWGGVVGPPAAMLISNLTIHAYAVSNMAGISAYSVNYSTNASGLAASNVQSAIDTIAITLPTLEPLIWTNAPGHSTSAGTNGQIVVSPSGWFYYSTNSGSGRWYSNSVNQTTF